MRLAARPGPQRISYAEVKAAHLRTAQLCEKISTTGCLKAPELGQPRLHTTSGSWPVQRQPGKEKMLLPARRSFYKSFASLPAASAVGQFCVAGPNSPALGTLTLPDRLLPCFWLLILDASFVPLHVHKHLRPSRRPSESS